MVVFHWAIESVKNQLSSLNYWIFTNYTHNNFLYGHWERERKRIERKRDLLII